MLSGGADAETTRCNGKVKRFFGSLDSRWRTPAAARLLPQRERVVGRRGRPAFIARVQQDRGQAAYAPCSGMRHRSSTVTASPLSAMLSDRPASFSLMQAASRATES